MEKEIMTRHKSILRQPARPVVLAALFLALSTTFTTTPVESKSRKVKAEKVLTEPEVAIESESAKAASSKNRTVSLTLKQMGAWSSIKLRGVDSSQTLVFPIRTDEVVVSAKLKMAYDYSPALIPELSHLRILINERIAAVEALPKDKGIGNAREINLDPRLFNELNSLRFNLIGHYTRQCEDSNHSSLWLTLSDLGRLELTLAPLSVTPDLKNLPNPFFDKRENSTLKLPFVFANAPSLGTLKAAGIVASWFGIQAGVRGAQFPASLNALPDGNAVVFLQGSESVEGIKGSATSSVSIQPHPTNSQAKLLVVTGSNEDELARAARAIALFTSTLSGQQVTVTKETDVAPRKPYDAPAWIQTDRPVRFGEIARLDELRVQGYYPDPIRVNYRVSPDLFTWRTPGTPVKLKYRATRLPIHKSSSLNIGLNANFVQALALNEPEKKIAELERTHPAVLGNFALREESLFLPPYALGGRDQLQLGYYFDVIKQGECQNLPPDNLQGAIDAESTIDFSGFPRYIALPNLTYFTNIGFPFTRMADLSETAVVMPDAPNADELSAYLMLMGRMGEATGYPALRHAMVTAANVEKMSGRDLIVIGSAKSQNLMTTWADRLPMSQINGERKVREPEVNWKPTYRWEQQDIQAVPSPKGSLNLSGIGGLTTLMAFESPLQASRSVVFLYADKAADLKKISDALVDPERASMVHGDFVVVDDKSINFAKVSETYYLGALPVVSKFRWFLSDQPLLLAFIGLLVCILMAAAVYRPLRRIIEKRFKK